MLRKKQSVSFVAGFLVFCLGVQAAWADFFGGDLPLLTAIVTNTSAQLTKLGETLSTLRKSYEDAKRVASYADDAYQAYQHFSQYSAQMFRDDVTRSFESAYPDVAYFRREAAHGAQMESVDDEAGLAIAASSSQTGRDQIARAQAESLREQCMGAADDDSLAACQAAANLAQIQALKQTTELTDQVAESNRL